MRLFLLLAALLLAAVSCFAPRPARGQALAAEELPGPWLAVARGTVDTEAGLMRLAVQREGLIAEVMADVGDHVTKGQALAKIDDTSARLALEIARLESEQTALQRDQARLKRDQARSEVARLAPMAKADAIPRRQFDEADRAATLAEADLALAEHALRLSAKRLEVQEAELEARIVRAPVDGVILRRGARPGDGATISTVTEMFLLAPDGPRVLRAQLDEQFVGRVAPGQRAEVSLERDDGTVISAVVTRVAPVFGTAQAGTAQRTDDARTVEMTLRLEGPPEALARLVLGQRMIARVLK